MKRILSILLVFLLLAIAVMLVFPLIFKNTLLEFSQRAMSRELNAPVEVGDLKISLFRHFPNASLEMKDLVVYGDNNFQSDTLLFVPVLRTNVGLASLFNPSKAKVSGIRIEGASLNIFINEDGSSNWTFGNKKELHEGNKELKVDQAESFDLQLGQIGVYNSNVYYTNRKTGLQLDLKKTDWQVSGEMYGETNTLKSSGSVDHLSLRFGGISYLTGSRLNVNTTLNADFKNGIFTIAENETVLDRLPFQVNGSVAIPADSVLFDLSIGTEVSDFENFLALFPKSFDRYLKDAEVKGSATTSGAVKGYYHEGSFPAFNCSLVLENGQLQYAGKPQSINNIEARIRVEKPQGELDLTRIEVQNAHARIGDDKAEFDLSITSLVSDPYFDGSLKGRVDLSHLKDALPLDSLQLSGFVDADLEARGKYSDFVAEAYDKILSQGTLQMQNLAYDSPRLTRPIQVPIGKLNLAPQNIQLSDFLMVVGQSDFRLSGTLNNYLNYIFKEGTLRADLRLNSRRVNLNELFRLKKKERNTEAPQVVSNTSSVVEEKPVLAFNVPARVDLTFRSNIANALINRIPIRDLQGVIKAADKKLVLQNLSMNMLDGQLNLNGSYQNTSENRPVFDFGFNVRNFDIPAMFSTFSGFQEKAPGAINSTGKLSSKMQLSGRLNEQLEWIPATINGEGTFGTQNLEIVNSPVFNKLNGIISRERLQNVRVDDFTASLRVENGNLFLEPFETKVIGQETKVVGSLSAENQIDKRLDFEVEREAFGPDIQKILAVIPGNEKIKMLPAGVVIQGPVEDPKVSPDLSSTTKAVAEATKDDVKDSLEKIGKGLLKMFKR